MIDTDKQHRKTLRAIWRGALHRCLNPTTKDYPRYGGRGITVCQRWRESFDAFASDAGERPEGYSLNRIDNDGGYWCGSPDCPECGPLGRMPNCQWASPAQQARNRRPGGPGRGRQIAKLPKTERFYLSGTGHVPWFKDITGQKFGKLTVIRYTDKTRPKGKAKLWLCRCECGKTTLAEGVRLRMGRVRSCGCLTPRGVPKLRKCIPTRCTEYQIWCGIQQRCHNPRAKAYRYYGERGIKVCEHWRADFNNFVHDMGKRPSPAFSLDRIDNDGDYCPENCRWATPIEQARNRRGLNLVTWQGETKTVTEWAHQIGMNAITLFWRLRHWPKDKAFTRPVVQGGKGRPRPKGVR